MYFFPLLALLLILGLMGVGRALYGGNTFRELLVTWGVGLLVFLVIVVVGAWLALKCPWIGIPFVLVAGLYAAGWMLKD